MTKAKVPAGQHVTLSIVEFDPATCDFTVAKGRREGGQPSFARKLSSIQASGASSGAVPVATSVVKDATWGTCGSSDYVCAEGVIYDNYYSSGTAIPGFTEQYITVYDPIQYSVLEDGNRIIWTYDSSTYCFIHAFMLHYTVDRWN